MVILQLAIYTFTRGYSLDLHSHHPPHLAGVTEGAGNLLKQASSAWCSGQNLGDSIAWLVNLWLIYGLFLSII